MSIDLKARLELARHIRRFTAGAINNREWEAATEHLWLCPDRAVQASMEWMWFLYDDIRTHRLTGTWKPPRETRRDIAAIVLMLWSDEEYLWPCTPYAGCGTVLLRMLTLGLLPRRVNPPSDSDMNCWPFYNRAQLRRASDAFIARTFAPGR